MANILVVDDEPGIRELLSEILYDEGHTVELAETAAQARAARLRARPDLVLLDIWMPDSDGVSLLKEWRTAGHLDMPVVMMSGHATIDTAIDATRIGAVAFLEKPIALQRLLETVNQALADGFTPAPSATKPPQTPPPAPQQRVHHDATANKLGHINLDQPLRPAREEFERSYFNYHLKLARHNMARVAEQSGLERTNLYRKLKQLGVAGVKETRGRGTEPPSD